EHAAERRADGARGLRRRGGLEVGVRARLPHEQHGDDEAHEGDDDPEIERLRPQGGLRRDVAGDPRHHPYREIPGELVEPEREAAPLRPHEIDLHDHRHRPRHRLVRAEEHVGEIDPPPRGRPDDEKRHGQGEEPADHQDRLAPDAVGRPRGDEVDDRLRHAEAHDERRDGRLRAEPEFLLAEERQHRALQPHHRADEGVQDDEERELREVLAQPEATVGGLRPTRVAHSPVRLRRRFSAKAAGCGGRSARTICTNHGSVPRVRSVTTIETPSGVCPGVCRNVMWTLPIWCSSPSARHTCGKPTAADSWTSTGAPVTTDSRRAPETWSAWTCVSTMWVTRIDFWAAASRYGSISSCGSTTAHAAAPAQPKT